MQKLGLLTYWEAISWPHHEVRWSHSLRQISKQQRWQFSSLRGSATSINMTTSQQIIIITILRANSTKHSILTFYVPLSIPANTRIPKDCWLSILAEIPKSELILQHFSSLVPCAVVHPYVTQLGLYMDRFQWPWDICHLIELLALLSFNLSWVSPSQCHFQHMYTQYFYTRVCVGVNYLLVSYVHWKRFMCIWQPTKG